MAIFFLHLKVAGPAIIAPGLCTYCAPAMLHLCALYVLSLHGSGSRPLGALICWFCYSWCFLLLPGGVVWFYLVVILSLSILWALLIFLSLLMLSLLVFGVVRVVIFVLIVALLMFVSLFLLLLLLPLLLLLLL